MANYGQSELLIAMIEAFGAPRPTSFGLGELEQALINAIAAIGGGEWGRGATATLHGSGSPVGVVTPTGEGDLYVDVTTPGVYQATGLLNTNWRSLAGVISFNTRTGAVVLSLADVAAFFTAAGDLYVGQGPETGTTFSLPTPFVPGLYLQSAAGPSLAWGGVPVITTTFTSNAYTLVITDANSHQQASNASAATITVPLNASVAFPVGTVITFTQTGAGKVQLASSATIRSSVSGGFVSGSTGCRAEYSSIGLINVATDVWVLSGDVA